MRSQEELTRDAVLIGLDHFWRDNHVRMRFATQREWMEYIAENVSCFCSELMHNIREAARGLMLLDRLRAERRKPKYDVPKGAAIDRLGEECSEVVQELFKIKRFGMTGTAEWIALGHETPRNRLRNEVGDVLQVIDELVAERFFTRKELLEAKRRKAQKLKETFNDG